MSDQALTINVKTGERTLVDLTADETAEREARNHFDVLRAQAQAETDLRRQSAYAAESDPLYFKWQRGEATQQDWLDKVAEIQARYPDPEV